MTDDSGDGQGLGTKTASGTAGSRGESRAPVQSSDGFARFGAIDVLDDNAGHGHLAALEEGGDASTRMLFATNFSSPIALIKAVLRARRARRAGVIVNMSPFTARIPIPGTACYAASNAALEGASYALAEEIAPLGINVMAVEPGRVRTDFAARSIVRSVTTMDDYAQTVAGTPTTPSVPLVPKPGDPARAARVIIKAVEADEPVPAAAGEREPVGLRSVRAA
ncbi:SDR family NAD(P)-dependent oxidoreductase [Nonomuraea sp. FMUSA5-5]|uniref:SDR family NAD(P)-dependent oxidoreductase n=1 Tax=Nonomuraea composti TaxID=2720023 RepID=A0ABX1BAK3_9ACTN|nr:SDR family NAD(P)-dependent oxidoreductase [Nonomuraea sp. FMUSA5-5]NJP94809.1 SDR family NAD(P)-dependent oxidoreductase [Nonomuraea sp. FMUSA5-5]